MQPSWLLLDKQTSFHNEPKVSNSSQNTHSMASNSTGPKSWPIIGNFMDRALVQLAQFCGPLISPRLCSKIMVLGQNPQGNCENARCCLIGSSDVLLPTIDQKGADLFDFFFSTIEDIIEGVEVWNSNPTLA